MLFFFTSDASQESRVICLFDIESNYYIRARYIFISLAINKRLVYSKRCSPTRVGVYIHIYKYDIAAHNNVHCWRYNDTCAPRPSSSNRCRLFSILIMDRTQKFSPGKNNLPFWKIIVAISTRMRHLIHITLRCNRSNRSWRSDYEINRRIQDNGCGEYRRWNSFVEMTRVIAFRVSQKEGITNVLCLWTPFKILITSFWLT